MEYLTVDVQKKGYIYNTIIRDIFIPGGTYMEFNAYDLVTYLVDIKALFRFVDPSKLTLRIKYKGKYYHYKDFCEMIEPGGLH